MKKEEAEILRKIAQILEQEGLISKEELIRIMALLQEGEHI